MWCKTRLKPVNAVPERESETAQPDLQWSGCVLYAKYDRNCLTLFLPSRAGGKKEKPTDCIPSPLSSIHEVMLYLHFLFRLNETRIHERHLQVQQDGAQDQQDEEEWLQQLPALRLLLQI